MNNEISIDGTVYVIDGMAILQSFETNEDSSYDRDIEIFSSNLFIEFDLNTDSNTGVSDGTYLYSDVRQAFTFFNIEIEIQENNTSFNIQQGNVTLDSLNTITTITFDLIGQNGEEIIGQWSGNIE